MFSRNAKPALGLAMLLGLLPAMALAAPPQGQWRGQVQSANTDIAVDMKFNAQVVVIHFAEPLSCSAPAKLLKSDGTAIVYRFGASPSGGRFCDSLLNSDLTVTQASDAELSVAFVGARKTWSGKLSPR
jgi:hypothetical protein